MTMKRRLAIESLLALLPLRHGEHEKNKGMCLFDTAPLVELIQYVLLFRAMGYVGINHRETVRRRGDIRGIFRSR